MRDLLERLFHDVLIDVDVEGQPELVQAEGNAPDRETEAKC